MNDDRDDKIPAVSAAEAERPESPAAAAAPRAARPLATAATALALLLAAASLIAAGYLYWRAEQDRQVSRAGMRALTEGLEGRPDRSELRELRAALADAREAGQRERSALQERLAALEQGQARQQRALASLRELLGRERDDWVLAEVDYLLRVANHRLRLQSDHDGAARALEAADERLHELADPALLDLRATLAEEVARLRAAPRPDPAGLALRLEAVAAQVTAIAAGGGHQSVTDGRGEGAPARAGDEGGGPMGRLGRWVSSLVTVSHSDAPEPRTPAPGLERARRHTLEAIAFARAALLAGDEEGYRRELDRALEAFRAGFDEQAAAAGAVIAELQALRDAPLSPPLPDIGESLRLLEAQRERRGRPEPGRAAPAPGADAQGTSP